MRLESITGQDNHFVAVPTERDPNRCVSSAPSPPSFRRAGRLAGAVQSEDCGAGVDWGLLDPLYEIEQRGFQGALVNARDVHNAMRGRRC